ncbi:MAG: lysine--tRNA ligase [Nanoarchaeota archaeon]|nr:lysine--tRNA ligase [Nanoarchaeota archaeon]
MAERNEYVEQRIKKIHELREKGVNPFPYSFNQKNHSDEILKKHSSLNDGEESKISVSVAGRLMTFRPMGKAGFAHIQDEKGRLQIYVREDIVGKENFDIFSKLDVGDIIGVSGLVFKTKKGEISVKVKELTLLTKGIRPLPEKWHGLKDVEIRYRKRYLDLISNPKIKEIFFTRSKIIDAIKEYLKQNRFLEVETPILQPLYGGANARPFTSFLHDLKMDVYLRISDELYLKKLIVGGFERVFEMGKDFRNESIDRSHNPEFTMMECYAAYWDYEDMMNFTEDLYIYAAKKVFGSTKFEYGSNKIDFKKPWPRYTMVAAIKKFADIDIEKLDDKQLKEQLKKHNIKYEGEFTSGLGMQLLFEELVEDKLIQPTFIIDHPIESTALCKPKRGNPKLIERFEPFCCGMEIGNAYSELNDPILQRKLFEREAKQLEEGNEEAVPLDEDFLESLEYGMPPTGGLGIGIDRMVMLMTGSTSIRDVLLFPFMKPEDASKTPKNGK